MHRLRVLSPGATILFALAAMTGCFEDPSANDATTSTGDGDGDPGTSGDGDGDPSTGDGDGDPSTGGDGDGDPSTGDGDGDGDPSTGDGDGDPSTGDGDPSCDDEYVYYDMFEVACDDGEFWTWDGRGNFTFIACGDPPGVDGQGWGRTLNPADGVEGSLAMPRAIEIGPWTGVDGASAGADFNGFDLSALCQPRLRMEVACGYGPNCDAEFWVQVKDSALEFDAAPLYELIVNEIPEVPGSASVVDVDLTPYQDKVVNFTILVRNPVYDPDDVMLFGWPRIVANQ